MDKAAELMWQLEDSPCEAAEQEQSPDDVNKSEAPEQPAHRKDNQSQSHNLHWETLCRQFVEYEQVAPFLIPEEQQRRLLDFLPLFLKVCSLCLWCWCQGCTLIFCFCVFCGPLTCQQSWLVYELWLGSGLFYFIESLRIQRRVYLSPN